MHTGAFSLSLGINTSSYHLKMKGFTTVILIIAMLAAINAQSNDITVWASNVFGDECTKPPFYWGQYVISSTVNSLWGNADNKPSYSSNNGTFSFACTNIFTPNTECVPYDNVAVYMFLDTVDATLGADGCAITYLDFLYTYNKKCYAEWICVSNPNNQTALLGSANDAKFLENSKQHKSLLAELHSL